MKQDTKTYRKLSFVKAFRKSTAKRFSGILTGAMDKDILNDIKKERDDDLENLDMGIKR